MGRVPISISVVIPVGPKDYQSSYLLECLESVNQQTTPPEELIVVDDSGTLESGILECPCVSHIPSALVFRPLDGPLGIAGAFNFGLSMAQHELVFFLGSDDKLKPDCLRRCWQAYHHYGQALGWYSVGVEYSNGFSQNTPCLAAMVSKELWKVAGPLKNDGEHNYAGCEVEYISRMLLANGRFGATYRVADETLYWFRMRPELEGNVGIAK